ncbi:MAG: hypothetical protein GYA57_03000 [Myxococcales bacterium]|nr:hypothetical protein [Myxococcales bacterium]
MRRDIMRRFCGSACGLAALLWLAWTPSAGAQSRRARGEESSSERAAAERAVWDFVHFTSPTELVDVLDAADGDDPFDISLSVAYQRSLRRAKIVRECRNPLFCQRDDGAGTQFVDYVDIARYTQVSHMLDLLLTVGLYHDLHFYTRWPLILSDTRDLDYEDGTNHTDVDAILGGLFDLPFSSPERSGIDWFAVGFSYAPFNQERDPTEPTWVLNLEGRFGIGPTLTPAESGDGNDGGMSKGVNEIRFGTALSRRFRWVEPYSGLFAKVGIPKYDTFHHFDAPLEGQINTMPPVEGTLLFGLDIIPWENLERFQKFSIGIEISGTYHSEGRDYSELFDALGTSTDARLTYDGNSGPGCETPDNPATPCWNSQYGRDELYAWSGMTDVENYGTFAGRLTFMVQAAKYVKFAAGVGFAHDQEHYITFTDECNSEVDGTCTIGGAPYNPMTREVIDAPGNRFRVQETTIFDVFASVTAMF